MEKTFTFSVLLSVLTSALWAQGSHTISGCVQSEQKQPLVGVNVYIPSLKTGTTTDVTGHYKLTVPAADSLAITFSYIGYATAKKTIYLTNNPELNVWLKPGYVLDEIVVKSSTQRISDQVSMSRIDIPVDQLKKIPALLGERDVLKVIQLLPGVQKGTEGNTGVYVRGGGPDQNLIILDDAVVYNPSHLFGFFSVFNGDVLKNVELTKGGFSAQHGGRLSSVIEMTTKDGNQHQLHGEGSIGLIASRFTLEGPLKEGGSSFLLSGRRSYYGLLMSSILGKNDANGISKTYFYDYNAKVTIDAGRNNKISLSGYTGYDVFQGGRTVNNVENHSNLNWRNTAATLRWNHHFSDHVSANTSLIYSAYQLEVANQDVISDSLFKHKYQLKYISGIRDISFKYDLNIYANQTHQVRIGLASTYHHFTPNAVVEKSEATKQPATPAIDVFESGAYVEDQWSPVKAIRLNVGLRLSYYQHHKVRYIRPEPRLSAAFQLPDHWSLKASFSRMNQYMHMLSNSGIGLPVDLWVPVTDQVKPQQSSQIAVGLAKDFTNQGLALSVEGYHKKMSNIISYKEGASFLVPDDSRTNSKVTTWENNVTAGNGWSYGAEVLIQKRSGRLTGWIGYTLSWTQWQFADLNEGKKFFPRYDRRHDVSVVGIYELSSRIRLSGTWVYGTGQALTLPLARYNVNVNNSERLSNSSSASARAMFGDRLPAKDYGQKNSFRAEPYHRLDVSLQWHSQRKGYERTWEFSAYNTYNRQNPFFYSLEGKVDAVGQPSRTVLYRYSLFSIIPTISYSFKF